MAARRWTDAQKEKQAALIRSWKPWTKSTGAKTLEGKAVSSKNVLIGQERKRKGLEQAKLEVKEALAKLNKLNKRFTIALEID